jgi:hypothetical protein
MRFSAPILATALVFGGGCASVQKTHKRVYIGAAVTKQVVTESHEIYSNQLNAKVSECDPDNNPKITSEELFDECLGPYAYNDDVVMALEVYKAAAELLFKYLKNEDPDKEKLLELSRDAINAAFDLAKKFPESQAVAHRLEKLVGRK